MIKTTLLRLGKQLVYWGLNIVYNFIDKDHDGKLDREEIEEFIYWIRQKARQLKNRTY